MFSIRLKACQPRLYGHTSWIIYCRKRRASGFIFHVNQLWLGHKSNKLQSSSNCVHKNFVWRRNKAVRMKSVSLSWWACLSRSPHVGVGGEQICFFFSHSRALSLVLPPMYINICRRTLINNEKILTHFELCWLWLHSSHVRQGAWRMCLHAQKEQRHRVHSCLFRTH